MTMQSMIPEPEPVDNDSLSALYSKYAKRVYAYALKGCQGNKHDAEEVVNETFLCAHLRFRVDFAGKELREREARLIKIAGCRIVDVYRRNQKLLPIPAQDLDELFEGACTGSNEPLGRVVDRETLERLRIVLMRYLTPTEHQVAFLTWQMGLPDRIIATLLGIPTTGTVRTHRSNAKAKIKAHVGDGLLFPDEPSMSGDDHGEGVSG